MGYQIGRKHMERLFHSLTRDYIVFAPVRMAGEGMYSDTDVVRYGQVTSCEDIEWEVKSHYSFKETILPITQILFYFTEDQIKEADQERRKPAVLFMRSCDVHAMKRLDEIYLKNRFEDYYYKRLRDQVKIVLMGCGESCGSGFCVSMGTNRTGEYDAAVNWLGADEKSGAGKGGGDDHTLAAELCVKDGWDSLLDSLSSMDLAEVPVSPDSVTENQVKVKIPGDKGSKLMDPALWEEYDSRCIACGRCNFVCPTCTCFTMQDIFYQDNGKAGERRRVHASCMVDG